VLDFRAVTCHVDDFTVSERGRQVEVNRTVHGVVATLNLAANEDEHLYPSLVLLDEDLADILARPEDHPELKASRFTLAVTEAAARTPKVDQLR
jgi:hypothetical protein